MSIPEPPDLKGSGFGSYGGGCVGSSGTFNEAMPPRAPVDADGRRGDSSCWGKPPGGARGSNRVVGDIGAFPTPLASVLPSPVASEAYVRDKVSGQFSSLGSSGVLQGAEYFDQKAASTPFANFAPFGGQPTYVVPPAGCRMPGTAQSGRVPGTAKSGNYLTQGIPSNPDLSYLTRTPLGSTTLGPLPRIREPGPKAPHSLPPAPDEDVAMPRQSMEETAPLGSNDLDDTRLVHSNNSNQLLTIPGSMRDFHFDPFEGRVLSQA